MRGSGRLLRSVALKSYRERLATLKNVPTFLKLVWSASPLLTGFAVSARAVRAVMPALTLYVGKLIVDEVVRLHETPHASVGVTEFLRRPELRFLLQLVVAEFSIAIASDVLARLVLLLDSALTAKCGIVTSVRVMRHAATLDLAQFEDSTFQDKLERARAQASGGMAFISQIFSQAQELVTVIALVVSTVFVEPRLVVFLVITLLPAFLGESHFNALSYQLNHSRAQQRRELDYLRGLGASAESAKELKAFALSDFIIGRFQALAYDAYRLNNTLSARRMRWNSVAVSCSTVGYYASYVYIVLKTVGGLLTLGDLTFLAGTIRRMRSSFESLLSGITQIGAQALYLDDLFSFLQTVPSMAVSQTYRPIPVSIEHGIELRNVGFRYPGSDRWVLRNVNLKIQAGETVALVGENGAGKTTLIKLLTRLYDPTEGSVLLDGVDIREYDLADLRRNVGVIYQDFIRFQLSAADNIAIGQISKRDDRARVEAAAAAGLADQFIRTLPAQFDQLVGNRFGGIELSGGQWQRLALARAYMSDAQLLVLDEPTASLDAMAESEVFQQFKILSAGKTTIVISHRLSSARTADRIVLLGREGIDAIGPHAELMVISARYAELFELQAAGYR